MSNIETKVKIKPNLGLQEPPLFKIIYINDEVTSMEFVVASLIDYFSYNTDTAAVITKSIHDQGSAVVAILPYEIAEQKGGSSVHLPDSSVHLVPSSVHLPLSSVHLKTGSPLIPPIKTSERYPDGKRAISARIPDDQMIIRITDPS